MITSVKEKDIIVFIYSNHHPQMTGSNSAFSFKDELSSYMSNWSWMWVKE